MQKSHYPGIEKKKSILAVRGSCIIGQVQKGKNKKKKLKKISARTLIKGA